MAGLPWHRHLALACQVQLYFSGNRDLLSSLLLTDVVRVQHCTRATFQAGLRPARAGLQPGFSASGFIRIMPGK